MVASQVSTSNVDVNQELDYFSLDLTAGASTTYVFTPNVMATGRVAVGWMSPLLSSIIGGSKFHPSGEVEVGWRPFSSSSVGVMVSGTASLAREWIIAPRTMTTMRAGLNLTFTFGNQTPKAARKPQTETTTPPVATASETVCKQDATVCKLVEQNSPPEVKAAFQECGRASIEADRTGNAGTQPETCRRAAGVIAEYYKANEATMTDDQKKLVDVAAASNFSLSALGYTVTKGKNSAEACEMTEQLYNRIIRSMPEQAAQVNLAVQECRAKWACQSTPEGEYRCTAK
jgi:hypothetical protein